MMVMLGRLGRPKEALHINLKCTEHSRGMHWLQCAPWAPIRTAVCEPRDRPTSLVRMAHGANRITAIGQRRSTEVMAAWRASAAPRHSPGLSDLCVARAACWDGFSWAIVLASYAACWQRQSDQGG